MTDSLTSTKSHTSTKSETQDDASSRKSQVRWSDEMKEKMIMGLHKEVDSGGKTHDNRWKTESLKRVAQLVMGCTKQQVESHHVRHCLKTLKKDWALANVCLNKSGFGIDPVTRAIDAEPSVWAEYVKANPDAASLREKKFPFYKELCLIFGKDYATGSICIEGHDVENSPLSVHNKSMIDILDDDESVDVTRSGADPFEILGLSKAKILVKSVPKAAPSNNDTSSTSSKGKLKRPRSRLSTNEDLEMVNSFKGMTKAAEVMAGAMASAFHPPDYGSLDDLVAKIPGFSDENVFMALDLFEKNRDAAAVFQSLPEARRALWIRRKLGLPAVI